MCREFPRLFLPAVTPILSMQRFAKTCEAVGSTTKKTEKVQLASELLRDLPLDDAARAAIFLTGHAFPRRDERVLGVGGAQLSSLIAELAGPGAADFNAAYRQHGDLGDMAKMLLETRVNAPGITLGEIDRAFEQLPLQRTQAQKLAVLRPVFEKAKPGEIKYIVKIVTGDLRIGLKESLVEEAIAKAFNRPIADVRRANMLRGDISETLRLAAQNELGSAALQFFRPIGFMLATPVETAAEIFDGRIGPMRVEEKYDGIRAQVHKTDACVRIFSRTLDEVTEFPELAAPLSGLPGSLILDGEILAWRDGRPLPFVELQKRLGRKQSQLGLWAQQQVPVKLVAFDLLYQDGDLLLDQALSDRRRRLEGVFSGAHRAELGLAPQRECDSAYAVERAFRESLAAGHEGIVVKNPTAPYMPGRRGQFWFKLKEPFATLDVVVTAVEWGHGKRHGVLSDYTFAVREGERLLNIGKAYSGLTDAEILEYTQYFLKHTMEDQGYRRIVEPTIMIEVAFNNIQRSNRHNSGYALRFPRIVRLRPDKSVQEIDTLDRVANLFHKQGGVA